MFAALAVLALIGLTGIKPRWRTTWGAMGRRRPYLMQVLNAGGGTHCPYCAMQCA